MRVSVECCLGKRLAEGGELASAWFERLRLELARTRHRTPLFQKDGSQARVVYGGEYKSDESTGGTSTRRLEECKWVAANHPRVTFTITSKSCCASGCISTASLSLVPDGSLRRESK